MIKNFFRLIAVIAVIVLISGVTLLANASPGTSSDPLITLSYLNGPFRTLISGDINTALSRITSRIGTAESRITDELTLARGAAANTFEYVTIANGTLLTLPAGSEIMLREGTVTLSGGTLIQNTGTPGDVSSGNLAPNNMYIADGQVKLMASGGSAKVWVRTDSSAGLMSEGDMEPVVADEQADDTDVTVSEEQSFDAGQNEQKNLDNEAALG